MHGRIGGDGAGPTGPRPELERDAPRGTMGGDGVTPDEAEAIEKLAEIFVDAMMWLEREHGLTPRQMRGYYEGRLDLKKDKEGAP